MIRSSDARQDVPVVLVERRGAAAWVTFNRAEALNAIDGDVVEALDRALDEAADDDAIRALVVTGAGRAFCAGADLRYVGGLDRAAFASALAAFSRRASTMYARLERFPKPTIAAVNGVAVAGGLEIVLCCDLVVAADTARIGDAHANYGLVPGGGGSARLPRRVGRSRAKELMLTGRMLPAAELASWGLVNRVVAADELDAAVEDLVAAIAEKSPLGVAVMKRLADAACEQPLDAALADELAAFADYVGSDDVQEGLAAFVQRRAPRFSGR